jgi:hypothetical protein
MAYAVGKKAKKKGKAHLFIHPSDNGGHTVAHHYAEEGGTAGGRLTLAPLSHGDNPVLGSLHLGPASEVHSFGPSEHKDMISHVAQHLGIGSHLGSEEEEEHTGGQGGAGED